MVLHLWDEVATEYRTSPGVPEESVPVPPRSTSSAGAHNTSLPLVPACRSCYRLIVEKCHDELADHADGADPRAAAAVPSFSQ